MISPSARIELLPLFFEHGITAEEIETMTDIEFQKTLNGFFEPEPEPYYNEPPPPAHARPARYAPPPAAFDDGFGNGGLDEDEALRRAIDASLDDQLEPPWAHTRPSPQNEVGTVNRRVSSVANRYYDGDDEEIVRPNPKPTPLPGSSANQRLRDSSTQRANPTRPAQGANHPSSQVKSQTRPRPTPNTRNDEVLSYMDLPPSNANRPKPTGTGVTNKPKPTKSTVPKDSRTNRPVSKPYQESGSLASRNAPRSDPALQVNAKKPAGQSSYKQPNVGRTIDRKTPRATDRLTPRTPAMESSTAARGPAKPATKPKTQKTDPVSHFPDVPSYEPRVRPDPKPSTRATNPEPRITSQLSFENRPNNTPKAEARHTLPPNEPGKRQTYVNLDAIPDPTFDAIRPHSRIQPTFVEDEPIIAQQPPSQFKYLNDYGSVIHAPPRNEPTFAPPPFVDEPPPRTPPRPKSNPVLTESMEIRQIQDIEYIEAVEREKQKAREEEQKKRLEENKIKLEEAKKQKRANDVLMQFNSLAPEPEKGTIIAVQMPNGKRITRKFDPSVKGVQIYAWIAGQTLDSPEEEKLFLDSFEVNTTIGKTKVDIEKTLVEQELTGRIMLIINIL